jgi:hypothetical protein
MTQPEQSPTTRHPSQRRGRSAHSIVGAGLVAMLALAGCGQATPAVSSSMPAGALPSTHVHGISRDPGSGKVNLATHTGLFVMQPDASWQRVGPDVDLMGFAVSAPGTFYASGHPAAGVDLPAPVGLIKSTDAGATWSVLSRGGQSDFHSLTASSKGVVGYDDALRTTADGKAWSQGDMTAEPRTLAAAPDGSQVLATTEKQGLLSSTDEGRTWVSLPSAPVMYLTAWADSKTVVGVAPDGGLMLSTDAAGTWKPLLGKTPGAQVLSASRDKAGQLEILVVDKTAVLQSRDDGATFTDLKS